MAHGTHRIIHQGVSLLCAPVRAVRAGRVRRACVRAALVSATLASGCGDDAETHRLPPSQLGMTDTLAPIYDDGEVQIFEVRLPVPLSVLRPSELQRQALRERRVAPFPRGAWVVADKLEVQVSWTLANLDQSAHSVEILVDPWNEFGRYWPGLEVVDAQNGDALPNLSGIDVRRELPGLRDPLGRSSRIHGTFTFADMNELATDFATVINIIETVQASAEGDERIELVNHTFNTKNRSGRTPLTDRYTPEVIPGLIGFDIGLRTEEPANIGIEFVLEIVDHTGKRIRKSGETEPVLTEPDRFYTLSGM